MRQCLKHDAYPVVKNKPGRVAEITARINKHLETGEMSPAEAAELLCSISEAEPLQPPDKRPRHLSPDDGDGAVTGVGV